MGKIIEAGKEVAQSAENMPKSQEISTYFDAPLNCTDALCATYVSREVGNPISLLEGC